MTAPALKRTWRQIPLEEGAPGVSKPLAQLKLEPAELRKRVGIRFEESEDDLDRMQVAIVRIPAGRTYVLVRYRNAPEPGTIVLSDFKKSEASRCVNSLLRGLHLRNEDLVPRVKRTRVRGS